MPLDGNIHKAAYKGDISSVEDILHEYPDAVNTPGAQNRTPLHRAVASGGGLNEKYDLTKLLLDHNGNPNLVDNGGLSALHWAASFGFTSIGQLLIDNKADVNLQTKSGEAPLHLCAEKGHHLFVKLLIDHQARIDIRDNSPNQASPFDAAKRAQQKECMGLLRSGGDGGCCIIM